MPTDEQPAPDAAPARRGPIFIIGAMGSGTTLVRLVLDSHPHIAIPRETGFMRAYDAHRFTPFKYSGRGWTKRLGWKPEELDEVMSELYERLFMRYAERHGKVRWGEKTPLHTWHVDDMARLFPDAQFVAMVRHPAASIASNMNRFGMKLRRSTQHWSRYTREVVRQAAVHGDRFSLIRYEDFVLRPEPLMRELLERLDEPWDDAVLQHHVVQGARKGRKQVEGRSRSDEPIDVSRIAKWKTTLGPRREAWIANRLTQQAAFLGYEITSPDVVEPLLSDGRSVASGTDIDERIDRYSDLDLRTQGEVPKYDQEYDPRKFMMLKLEQFDALTARQGVRGVGVRIARKLPRRRRKKLIRLVREVRAKAGLRRQPKRI